MSNNIFFKEVNINFLRRMDNRTKVIVLSKLIN